jgi:hypothetical protein
VTARTSVGYGAATLAAVAVALAVAAARHAHPAEVSPVAPAGGWNTVWVAALVAGFVAYCVGVVAVWPLRGTVVAAFAVAVVIQALPLAGPVILSKDLYNYWDEARIVTAHHASPYAKTPSAFPQDPALPYVSEEWRGTLAPYGPTWEALALPPAAVATTARDAATAYRVLTLAGGAVLLALLAYATRSAAGVALVGWNPLLALQFGGGGHNDTWLMALVVAAVVAARRAGGGVAWALAGAFKPVPLVLFPLDLAADRARRPRRFWIGLVLASVVVVGASAAAWGFGWIRASLVGVHGASPLGGVHWLMQAGLSHRDAVVAGGLVFVCIYAALIVGAWRTGRARLAAAATALCLTTSLLRPWYAMWPLALAGLELDELATVAAIALSAYLLFADAVSL